jgi:tetratricopeptide (TPR) repeat protein
VLIETLFMEDLLFWKNWLKSHRYLLLTILFLFISSLVYIIIGWVIGIDAVISWEVQPDFHSTNVVIDRFTQNLVHYDLKINSFLVEQQFIAGPIEINPISSYIYFALVIIGFLIFLTSISFLEIFWFGLGMAFFMVFLVTLKTELLGIFGLQNRAFLIAAIFTYLIISYYFHSINKKTSYLLRLVVFTIITFVFGLIIAFFSKEEHMFLFLANLSVPVPMVIAVLFMAVIGYDIIYVFLYFITSNKSTNPSSRLINYLVISGIYLFNLIIALSDKMGYLDWDIIYFSPFLVYMLSSICGIWVYKQKLKGTSTAFRPVGANLFIACAIISNAVIALAFITGNDPMVEMFEYFILYTHIAFGLIFFFYVIINFGDLFNKNVTIYKVTYQPRRSPYFIMQGISCVIIFALFLFSNRFPYLMGIAGYHNLVGDAYVYQNNTLLAGEYYKYGYDNAFQNHRSNYSLASLALQKGDNITAQEHFTQALVRNPSDYTFIQLSTIYQNANMFFPSVFMLQDGITKFPENGYIANNLGLLMKKTNALDSAIIYLQIASDFSPTKDASMANIVSILAQNNFHEEADSIAQIKEFENSIAIQSNALIANMQHGQKSIQKEKTIAQTDSILTGAKFPYLYNLGILNLRSPESSEIQFATSLSKMSENQAYKKHLELIEALHKWYTGNKFDAIRQIDILKGANEQSAPYFSKILGLLLFKQKSFANAANYLKDAHQHTDHEAWLYNAIALLEIGETEEAISILEILKGSELADIQSIANNLLKVLSIKHNQGIGNWTDELKFQYLHYKINQLDEAQQLAIYSQIESEEIKQLAASEIMAQYLNQGKNEAARILYQSIPQTQQANSYSSGEVNLQYLQLLANEGNWNELKQASTTLFLNDYAKGDAGIYQAKALAASGDSAKAETLYTKGLSSNPFNENLNLFAAEFYQNKGNKDLAYDILVTGLELNPNSISLYKSYIQLAYTLNLHSFADDALAKLKTLISDSEYRKYASTIKKNEDSFF